MPKPLTQIDSFESHCVHGLSYPGTGARSAHAGFCFWIPSFLR